MAGWRGTEGRAQLFVRQLLLVGLSGLRLDRVFPMASVQDLGPL